ncbi:MAG: sigma-70 family RNA polymerase sigma factor [Bacteroidales bacterium]|nr:sigma-70 family RNA polymerase sigma factor [Bacteroidales bacterium]
MKKLTLGQIVEGIRKRDNAVLSVIYKEIFPVVRYYVMANGGTQEDAKDVFQESMIIVFRKISRDSVEITTGFEAYLYGIARMVWLKILRNRDIHDRNIVKLEEPEVGYYENDELMEEDLEMRLFRKYFLKLGKECQDLLTMISEEVPYETIAKQMGYKNEKVVRNKKYKCKEVLMKMIKSDREYQKIAARLKK